MDPLMGTTRMAGVVSPRPTTPRYDQLPQFQRDDLVGGRAVRSLVEEAPGRHEDVLVVDEDTDAIQRTQRRLPPAEKPRRPGVSGTLPSSSMT